MERYVEPTSLVALRRQAPTDQVMDADASILTTTSEATPSIFTQLWYALQARPVPDDLREALGLVDAPADTAINRGHPSSSSSSGADAGDESHILPANLGAFIPSMPDDPARQELAEYQERVAVEAPAVRIQTDLDANIIEEQELGSSAPLPIATSAVEVPDVDTATAIHSPDTSIRSDDSPFDTKTWMRQLERRQQAKLDAAMQRLRQERTQDSCQLLEVIQQLLQPATPSATTVATARTPLSAEVVPTTSGSDVEVGSHYYGDTPSPAVVIEAEMESADGWIGRRG
jgi:hypothetical protein